ncbi:ECF-type riboflavin transporter substrate-binding protein [Streptococcus pneumoniae]
MKNNSIKNVVAVGIGAALFVVIGLISIPTPVPNTYIQLQYAVQALLAVIFGPVVGFLIGFIGHAIKDALQGGTLWWFWISASAIFGLIVGGVRSKLRVSEGVFDKSGIIRFNVIQVLANAFVWIVVAPFGDVLLYNEPVAKVVTQGVVSTIVNGLTVGIAGTLLILAYTKRQTKLGSLSKED